MERTTGKVKLKHAYGPSGLVVVPVHGRASVGPVLPGVGELPGHHAPKFHVLTAAAPLPALPRRALVPSVTAADGGRALGAGSGHGKSHPGRGDGVDKGRLPGGCGREKSVSKGQRGMGLISPVNIFSGGYGRRPGNPSLPCGLAWTRSKDVFFC